jgi:hypothetical protein
LLTRRRDTRVVNVLAAFTAVLVLGGFRRRRRPNRVAVDQDEDAGDGPAEAHPGRAGVSASSAAGKEQRAGEQYRREKLNPFGPSEGARLQKTRNRRLAAVSRYRGDWI